MNFVWHNTTLSDITLRSLEEIISNDLTILEIENPADLIFHHIKLGKTFDDPILFVWGEDSDTKYLHCEYVEFPKWVVSSNIKLIENKDY